MEFVLLHHFRLFGWRNGFHIECSLGSWQQEDIQIYNHMTSFKLLFFDSEQWAVNHIVVLAFFFQECQEYMYSMMYDECVQIRNVKNNCFSSKIIQNAFSFKITISLCNIFLPGRSDNNCSNELIRSTVLYSDRYYLRCYKSFSIYWISDGKSLLWKIFQNKYFIISSNIKT